MVQIRYPSLSHYGTLRLVYWSRDQGEIKPVTRVHMFVVFIEVTGFCRDIDLYVNTVRLKAVV